MAAESLPTPVLPRVTDLRWRPPTAADLDPWIALIARMQNADSNNERWTRSDLERSLGMSWVDLAADAIVGIDADGVFRAFGRNDSELRAADTHAATLPARIGTFAEEQEDAKARLLTAAGFAPRRWFDVMGPGRLYTSLRLRPRVTLHLLRDRSGRPAAG